MRAQSLHRSRLIALHLFGDLQQLDPGHVLVFGKRVDADDDALFGFERALVTVAGIGDLALEEAGLDRFDHAAVLFDLAEVLFGLTLHFVRECLYVVRASQRIDHVRNVRFICQDLLGTQRDLDRLFGGKREHFIHRVGVQRLRSAQHCGHRFVGDADALQPAVCVWKRSCHDLGSFAPYRSRMWRAQMRRAARYLQISSKKSMCALKKNERRGAKESTSMPAFMPASTYANPSASVKANSCTAVDPASRMWYPLIEIVFHLGI